MLHTHDPHADYERYTDSEERAAAYHDAVLKGLVANPEWQVLADGLDYSKGPKTSDVLRLLIDASTGKDVACDAHALVTRICTKWLDQNPEYLMENHDD